ncbi:MAG TPA: SDR family oxidoreductase [Solirubrobacteraceae bacterium]|nr:SDR family oxidoreductase [Solirubrobacteraceae bacterium]
MQRVWIVTGASRGIGEAIAAKAAAGGDAVACVARSPSGRPWAAGARVLELAEDLTAEHAGERVVAAALEAFGRIDVVVNNAGLHRGGRIETLLDEDFERVLATNLRAPLRLCRAAAPHLRAGGAIVNIGAVVGLRGFPGDSAYGSSKAGVAGLTRVLAIELARRGVTVNCVIPGFTETEMTAAVDERARKRLRERIPLGRPCTPEEVADVVHWVAGSPSMTGALIPVDGGLMAALGS